MIFSLECTSCCAYFSSFWFIVTNVVVREDLEGALIPIPSARIIKNELLICLPIPGKPNLNLLFNPKSQVRRSQIPFSLKRKISVPNLLFLDHLNLSPYMLSTLPYTLLLLVSAGKLKMYSNVML